MLATSELLTRFKSLMAGHAALRSNETDRLNRVLEPLLHGFLAQRKKWAEAQRKTADDFNLFRLLGVENNEVGHSKLLAWLLDHDIERGTHAQGNLGFRLFLEELEPELRREDRLPVIAYADETRYWVRTEISGDEARVDIEIAARGRFLIQIENKIWSAEGDDQTNREWRDLERRAIELGVPGNACHALFLTLEGNPATNEHFRAVGWYRIAKVLDRFAELAEPAEVRLFARHYARAVRGLSVVELETEEDRNANV